MRARAILLGALTALTLAACGGAPSSPAATPTPTPTPAGAADLTPILATTVLRVGSQRVAFLLESPTALISAPTAQVTTSFLQGDAPGESTTAVFHAWPYATRGAYATELTFDRPGPWRLDIRVDDGPFAGETELVVEVAQDSVVSDIGQVAPFSSTKTLRSVGGDFTKITSDPRPDPELYTTTVAEALRSGQPSVVVFASPAFCTSPTCGPQVDAVKELKGKYRGEANFIHVEVYDNPDEIQGDLDRGTLSPAVKQWGIDAVPHYLNESWVFVLGRDGRIRARFEGYATLEELDAALQAAS